MELQIIREDSANILTRHIQATQAVQMYSSYI